MNRKELPSGASSGLVASATRQEKPGLLVRAAQKACSGPSGSAEGLGDQPSRLGASPRRKMTVLPSSEMWTSDIMMPSSFWKFVRRTGVKPGAAAVYAFRLPSA